MNSQDESKDLNNNNLIEEDENSIYMESYSENSSFKNSLEENSFSNYGIEELKIKEDVEKAFERIFLGKKKRKIKDIK